MPPSSSSSSSSIRGGGGRVHLLTLLAAAAAAGLLLLDVCAGCPGGYRRCGGAAGNSSSSSSSGSSEQCVKEEQLCDTRRDCRNGADEAASLCGGRSCSAKQFSCESPGHCLPAERRCDGVNDCARSNSSDVSDEADCEEAKRRVVCDDDEFHCGAGQEPECVKDKYVCDRMKDCANGADEANCNGACSSFQFACRDFRCINATRRCDNIVDCRHGEDELDCPDDKGKCHFSLDFHCRLSGKCVSKSLLCDMTDDCGAGDDEICSTELAVCRHPDYWTCKSGGHCILKANRCDKRRHCPDASDEIDCPLKSRSSPQPCPSGKHRCNGTANHCVDIASVCRGTQRCPHADSKVDAECERLRLEADPCNRGNGGCQQLCNSTVHGGQVAASCSCRSGYAVDANNSSLCVDDNECLRYGACSQECANTVGSYRCSCRRGYRLHGNRCLAADASPVVLYSTPSGVGLQDVSGQNRRSLANELHFPNRLAFDAARRLALYITRAGQLHSVGFDGSGQRLLASGLLADAVAYDWTRRLLFAASPLASSNGSLVGVVQAVDVSSGRRAPLMTLHCPRGLAVHPQLQLLFVAQACGPKPGLYRFRIDGTQPQLLISSAGNAKQLALDSSQRPERIYWLDAGSRSILSCTLDGADLRAHWRQGGVHAAQGHSQGHDRRPSALAVFEDRLYWSEAGSGCLHSVRKFAAADLRRLAAPPSLLSMAIVHTLLQPAAGVAAGAGIRCSCGDVCVALIGSEDACLCSEGRQLLPDSAGACVDEAAAKRKQLTWGTQFGASRGGGDDRPAPERVGTVAGVVMAALTCCVLAFALLAAVWRIRRRRRRLLDAEQFGSSHTFGYFSKAPAYARMPNVGSRVALAESGNASDDAKR